MDESDRRVKAMAAAFQNYTKEPHDKETNDMEERKNKDENLETVKRGEENKSAHLMDSRLDCIQ